MTKDIHISYENWKMLSQLKIDLGFKTINDVVTKTIASFLKEYQRGKK